MAPAGRCSSASKLSGLRPRIRQGQDGTLAYPRPSGNRATWRQGGPTRRPHGRRGYPSATCGRFVQLPVVDFGQPGLAGLAPGLTEIQPTFNLAPTQRASVILDRGEGRQVTRMA